jgi:two-component system, OmpR family, phosphate regulon response regulator PhoB
MSTIVVVEDDPGVRDVVAEVLSDEGHAVTACAGADREALLLVEQAHPEVVILDYQLPGMSGVEIAHELHHRDGLRDVKIIGMTAGGRARWVCDEMEADACLAKPFDLVDLLTAVETVAHPARQ